MSDPIFTPKVNSYPYSTPSLPSVPNGATKSLGIFPSDIVIRTALISAMAELRQNTWLLDYVFAYLPQDALTAKEYGVAQKDQAKEWFLNTDIQVHMNYNFIQTPKFPAISIGLLESTEDTKSLGDVNYDTTDLVESQSLQTILGPLTNSIYDNSTGKLIIPNLDNIELTNHMLILDLTNNNSYSILNLDDNKNLYLATNLNINLDNSYVVPADQYFRVALESVGVRETYKIGCHVTGKPVFLIYLYHILVFCLLWGKQKFLESRGFERSTYASSDFIPEAQLSNEIVFSRYTNLTGYVRHFWPKSSNLAIQGVSGLNIQVTNGGKSPESIDLTQGWEMDLDKAPF